MMMMKGSIRTNMIKLISIYEEDLASTPIIASLILLVICLLNGIKFTLDLLEKPSGCVTNRFFLKNKIFFGTYTFLPGLTDIFHWYVQSFMIIRSLLCAEVEVSIQLPTDGNAVSSAKSLTSDFNTYNKSMFKQQL